MEGDYSIYRPSDVFRTMGRQWALEDKFSYLIDPNLQNSRQVHNTMRQEWTWLVKQQALFYEELVRY